MQQLHEDGQLYRAIILLEIRIEFGPLSESWEKNKLFRVILQPLGLVLQHYFYFYIEPYFLQV